MSKTIRQRHCFVPGCKNDGKQKLSLFAVPADDERFEVWKRALSGVGKTLEKKCVICEKHFESRFICRSYKHTINGQLVEIPRNRPSLLPEAVPTRFLVRPSRVRRRAFGADQPLRRGRSRNDAAATDQTQCAEADVMRVDHAVQEHLESGDTCDSLDYDVSSDSWDDDVDDEVIVLAPPSSAVAANTDAKRTVTPHIVTARKASPPPSERTGSAAAAPVPSVAPRVPTTATSASELPVTPNAASTSAVAAPKNVLGSPPVPGVEAPAFLADMDCSMLPNRYWTLQYVQHTSRHVAFSFFSMFDGQPTLTKLVTCEQTSDGITCQAIIDSVAVKTVCVDSAKGVAEFVGTVDALAVCQGAASAQEFSIVSLDNCTIHGDRVHGVKCDLLSPASSRMCDHCKHLRKLLQSKAAYHKRRAASKPGPDSGVKGEAATPTDPAESLQPSGQASTANKLLVQTCIQASKKDHLQPSGDKTVQDEEWTLECTFYPVSASPLTKV